MGDTDRNPNPDDRPDPDQTQRVPEIQEVVDRWFSRTPSADLLDPGQVRR